MFSKKNKINYKFNEGALIEELQAYIDVTYDGHYSKNRFQSTEFISDCGHGIGFAIGNILKYAQRYGKKVILLTIEKIYKKFYITLLSL